MRTGVGLAGLVAVGAAVAALADPAPREKLPVAAGRTALGRSCDQTEDCAPRSACVRSGSGTASASDGFTCKPLCAADADCGATPNLRCASIFDASAREYAERACAEGRGTLSTLLLVHGTAASGLAAWWDVGARMPEADVLRMRVALRVPVVRDLIKTRLVAAAQAAIAAKLGAVNLVSVRYSNFTPSVDRVGISRAQHDDSVRVLVSGEITATREKLSVGWNGTSWVPDGTEDVASYRAEVQVTAAVTPAPKLADQHLTFAVTPLGNSITINLSPFDGTVLQNAFTFDPPPPFDVTVGAYATDLPSRLQSAVVKWVRFGAIDDKELVIEARAE